MDAGSFSSAVRVVIITDKDFVMRRGDLLAHVEPAEIGRSAATRNVPPLKPERFGRNVPSGGPERSGRNVTSERSERSDISNMLSVDHIQDLNSLPDSLGEDRKLKAAAFMRQNAFLFSEAEFDLGRTGVVSHTIDTRRIGHSNNSSDAIRSRTHR